MNIKTSWESSLWMVDEVTQLLSNKNLKETLGKNKLVCSKLLEELNSLFRLARDLGPSTAYNRSSSDQRIFRPPSIANWVIYKGFRGLKCPLKILHNGG